MSFWIEPPGQTQNLLMVFYIFSELETHLGSLGISVEYHCREGYLGFSSGTFTSATRLQISRRGMLIYIALESIQSFFLIFFHLLAFKIFF